MNPPDLIDNAARATPATPATPALSDWRLAVAPCMDWTDRHCRYLHRLITRRTRVYSEMVTTGALLHGNVPRHLDFNDEEHPVALQLGGSEPGDLARSARLGAQWGYDEINLNCGCPSERVQRGAFGACLMAEPTLVRDCVAAMREVVDMPVTVKHRIGIDREESYAFVRDFVGVVAEGGCTVFIVHARNAWLQGLSPKENREIPPLRYEHVYQLKRDFPHLTFVLNGGVKTADEIEAHLAHVDGVMLGRQPYHEPWMMADWDHRFFGDTTRPLPEREAVEAEVVAYMARHVAAGGAWSHVARHWMGLWNGTPGARRWRQAWGDQSRKAMPPAAVAAAATAARTAAALPVDSKAPAAA
jgi:tRNA-dihydrouridine synthase A